MIANTIKSIFTIILAAFILASCASKDAQEPVESTEQAYYTGAKKALKGHNYTEAVELLEELESRYPFGRFAEQAQLDLIYAHYKSFDYEAARAAADRFIRLHPQHNQLDYAYYLRGLASFSQDQSFIDRFLPTDRTKRDPGSARESLADFGTLVARFPDSQYADDARVRMIYLRNLLAAYEVHVARYYLKRQAYVAAANRGRYVVENFPQTPSTSDGLAVMVEAYQQLGMNDLAEQSLNVLTNNYPEYPAISQAGEFNIKRSKVGAKRSLLNRATFGLLGKSEGK